MSSYDPYPTWRSTQAPERRGSRRCETSKSRRSAIPQETPTQAGKMHELLGHWHLWGCKRRYEWGSSTGTWGRQKGRGVQIGGRGWNWKWEPKRNWREWWSQSWGEEAGAASDGLVVGQLEVGIWKMWWLWGPEVDDFWLSVYFWVQSTVGVWQVLQIMMGSKTDKFMSGKGTEQIFRALWLLQAFSKSAVVFFSFFFQISFFFHF